MGLAIKNSDRSERMARGVAIGAFALACAGCGGDRHSNDGDGHAGNSNQAGSADRAGAENLGGSPSGGGRAGSDGHAAGAGDQNAAGAFSEGGSGGESGSGADVGTAGDVATDSGGAAAGGNSGGGDTGGATNVAGTNAGGTSSGGMDASGGTDSGGTNSGGTSSGGTSSGGTDSGGTNSGGANAAGQSSGGGPANCGDALLQASEECDDGNTQNLDGCDASCRYEVVDRMTAISVQGGSAPDFCAPTTNALGRAFSSAALAQVNAALQQSISNGVLNNLLQFSGLSDPSGASDDNSLSLGFFPATPDLAKGAWPGGTPPLDYWFRVPSTSVNAQGTSLTSLSGSLVARSLSAGPGSLKLPLAIGGAPSTLSVSNARLRATLNSTPAPNVPAPPPAALASGLTVFQSLSASGSGQGICGNVTVESLAHIPVPTSLASGATSACLACNGSRTYTACSGNTVEPGCNSMLDVLIGGCKAVLCFVTVVTPAQPDVPAAGSASVQPLSLGAGNSVPAIQATGNQDAYSSYFKFDANRAHITGVQ